MAFRMWLRLCIGLLSILSLTSYASETVSPDISLLDAGREIYQQRCAVCHGADAEGAPDWQKPNQRGDMPAPPHGSEGHTWRHSDAMLQQMISQGWRDPFNKTERLTMPAFQKVLAPQETAAVITYLKSLWTEEQRQYQQQESKARPRNPAQSQLLDK